MRKSSPRVLAGVLLLALFASVGLMTARAFSVTSVAPTTATATAVEETAGSWNVVRTKPTSFTP